MSEDYGWWLQRTILNNVPVVLLNNEVPLPFPRLYCLECEWDRLSQQEKKELHNRALSLSLTTV